MDLATDPITLFTFSTYLVLLVWERVRPARALPEVRGWALRGTAAFVLFFLVSSYLPYIVGEHLAALRVYDATGLGTFGGGLLVLFVYEALAYAWHRALHRAPWLWRGLHQMHHSSERIDVPSAYWFSPLDMVAWTLVSVLALTLVGISPRAMLVYAMVSTFLSLFQHTNVRTPRWLGYIVQRPENHAHHHARGRHEGNYANIALFDIVFGTFRNYDEFPHETGLGTGASGRVVAMLLFRDVADRRDESSPESEAVDTAPA